MSEDTKEILMLIDNDLYNIDRSTRIIFKELAEVLLDLSKRISILENK